MSDFCGLKFQSFPTEIRLQIYGLLLVNYDANEEYQRLHSDNDEALRVPWLTLIASLRIHI